MAKPHEIGFPGFLRHFKHYGAFKEFFNQLGIKIVESKETNKSMLNLGVGAALPDMCLPIKIFYGHILSLNTECIFMPRIVSDYALEYNCPKILSLPDMVKNNTKKRIISITIDVNKQSLFGSLFNFGFLFSNNPFKIYRACRTALKKTNEKMQDKKKPAIALLGRPYNIYDSYLNRDIIKKLEKSFSVATSTSSKSKMIFKKERYWIFEKSILQNAEGFMQDENIKGIIYVSCFSCGPDATIIDMIENQAKRFKKPLLILQLDEHASDIAINTRIESFIDMIK